MFINILVPELKQKIMRKPIAKYPTWQKIHQYIKEKMEARRDQSIADALHRPQRRPAGTLNAMGVDQLKVDAPPAMPDAAQPPQPPRMATFEELQQMVNAMAGKRPPDSIGKGRKGDGKGGKGNQFEFVGCRYSQQLGMMESS